MTESDIMTIPRLAQRAKADGLPASEFIIRRLVKTGAIPARYIGPKAVASYAALVRYFNCVDGCDNAPVAAATPAAGIRRVDVG